MRDATKGGKPFLITESEYESIISRSCYYCDCSFSHQATGGLDRIDNSLGYQITNILPACQTCNKMRGDYLTVRETRLLAQYLNHIRSEIHNDNIHIYDSLYPVQLAQNISQEHSQSTTEGRKDTQQDSGGEVPKREVV